MLCWAILGSSLAALFAQIAVLAAAGAVGFHRPVGLVLWIIVSPISSLALMFFYLRWATHRGTPETIASELVEKMAVLPLGLWSILVAMKVFGIDSAKASERPEPTELLFFFAVALAILFGSAYLWSKVATYLQRRYPWPTRL